MSKKIYLILGVFIFSAVSVAMDVPVGNSDSGKMFFEMNADQAFYNRQTAEDLQLSFETLSRDMADNKVARLLTCDGGGIRGIVPAQFLAEIEKYTAKSTSSMFHLMSGTSTGGIIVGGLSAPERIGGTTPMYAATDLVDLYLEHAATIFDKRGGVIFNPIVRLFSSKYSHKGISRVLMDKFGDMRLSESINDLLLTSYNLSYPQYESGDFFFKTHMTENNSRFQKTPIDFHMRDVLCCTTAAPTFFPPFRLKTIDEKNGNVPPVERKMIDGGVYANDPTLCSLIEAVELYPRADSYFILSLGTGYSFNPCDPSGLLGWAPHITDVLMNSASINVRHAVKEMSGIYKKKVYYARLQLNLSVEHAEMDDISEGNLKYLIESANHAAGSVAAESTEADSGSIGAVLGGLMPILRKYNKVDRSQIAKAAN
ncbi:MAG: patatin-like phospholipase family protein [Holosporaceae bacterium]|jgi:patatin-like phospholipase/acyl hydrolase|nr:patatin-like phospholipase family protein [Holosporaceae bacterium]